MLCILKVVNITCSYTKKGGKKKRKKEIKQATDVALLKDVPGRKAVKKKQCEIAYDIAQ